MILDQFGMPMDVQASNLSAPDEWLVEWLRGGPKAASGESVTASSALHVSAFFACVRNIATDVAKLPLILYKRKKPRGKDRADNLPLYTLLHDFPNDEMTAFTFRQTLTKDVLLYGNGYAEIVRDGAGMPVSLHPLDPTQIEPKRAEDGEIYYLYKGSLPVSASRILHLKNIGDGLVGWSILRLARETIGIAIAQDKYQGGELGNGAVPGGVLKTANKLDDQAKLRLRTEWERTHGGAANEGKTAVLEQGLEYQVIATKQRDAQFLERMQHSVEEIARWFRIPPHKIGHLLHATFSNIEHQGQEYLDDTLAPWLVMWEQEIKRMLIPKQMKDLFAEHLVTALLRGDQQARSEYYSKMWNVGALSQNDIRDLENQNPIGPEGDEYYVPLNFVPSKIAVEGPPEPEAAPKPEEKPEKKPEASAKVIGAHRLVIADAMHRILKTQRDKVERASKRDDFGNKMQEFFGGEAEYVSGTLSVPLTALAASLEAISGVEIEISGTVATFASEFVTRSVQEMQSAELVTSWTETRAAKEAEIICSRFTALASA